MATSTDQIDFSDIEEGVGRVKIAEGDYPAKVKSVKFATSQSANPMFVWSIIGTGGAAKGKEFTEYTALTKKALWKLRDLMEATVGKAPGGKVETRKLLDYCKKKVVGQPLGITVEDDEYVNDKGKSIISSKIKDYLSIDDLNAKPDEDDIEEDEDGDDLEAMSRADLKAHIKSEGLDITVKKTMSDDMIREAIKELAGDDDEEDDEDEDEEEDDELEGMSRAELRAHIKSNKLDVAVKKSMSDDDIRSAIREAGEDDDEEEEIEDVDLDEL